MDRTLRRRTLDALRDLIRRLRFCSFEQHVFQNVGQPCTEMLVFIDASGRAPRLHARHRRAVIFLHDDGQAVWQNPFLRRARRKRNHCRGFRWRSLQIDHGK